MYLTTLYIYITILNYVIEPMGLSFFCDYEEREMKIHRWNHIITKATEQTLATWILHFYWEKGLD